MSTQSGLPTSQKLLKALGGLGWAWLQPRLPWQHEPAHKLEPTLVASARNFVDHYTFVLKV
jgi:hypothetical protein